MKIHIFSGISPKKEDNTERTESNFSCDLGDDKELQRKQLQTKDEGAAFMRHCGIWGFRCHGLGPVGEEELVLSLLQRKLCCFSW